MIPVTCTDALEIKYQHVQLYLLSQLVILTIKDGFNVPFIHLFIVYHTAVYFIRVESVDFLSPPLYV